MKDLSIFSATAAALVFCTAAIGQQTRVQAPSGYHTVACFKIKPDRAGDFRKWTAGEMHRVAQGRVDDGEIRTWYLLRSVFPQGGSADCDYLVVSIFPDAPRELGREELDAAIKKSGLSISAQEYIDHRDAASSLVSVALFRNEAFIGATEKGDYFLINYLKVSDIDQWIDYEKQVWQPLADAMIREGLTSGWAMNVETLPRGRDEAFDAVTVVVYPTWDAVFKDDTHFMERFKRIHPDMEVGTTSQRFDQLRTILSTDLYKLEDMVTASK